MTPTQGQLQALGVMATKLGIGAIIAMFLVWKLAGSFESRLAADDRRIERVDAKLDALQAAVDRVDAARQVDARLQRAMLRGICLGTSGDLPSARALCSLGAE